MNYIIKNQYLEVKISDMGAQLQSIQNRAGVEFLWQGDQKTWSEKAPNLFPYIGRMTGKQYWYQGKTYNMGIHGFAKDKQFALCRQSQSELIFRLEADEETRVEYPFEFVFSICYSLEDERLNITYNVENAGLNPMYFGVGGHPGFQIPMDKKLRFEDYELELPEAHMPIQIGLSDDCFVMEEKNVLFELQDKKIGLRHDLFDQDAIVLKNMGHRAVLKSRKNTTQIQVGFPQMDYLGIWHWPLVEVDYVCIEPWSSLPSRKDVIEDIEKQDNLVSLNPGGSYRNEWWIEIKDSF
ncbi:MAG: aldose 1-epimerase family protein [Lachnospiraceae bacterium]|nr:aldose 1-epimerase family protein [Lachnospiraceae bacterium]